MYGRGILSGKLMMEICGKVRISCAQTGVFAKVEFSRKRRSVADATTASRG
jgi:hypothetical protein